MGCRSRNTAFYGTPLEFLLEELQADSLIICGIAADNNCVFFTAADAYVRKFKVWVRANCVASENDAWRVSALKHMKRVLKARTTAA